MDLKKVELPRTLVEPGGFAAFRLRELGTRLAFRDGEIFLTLASRDGRRAPVALVSSGERALACPLAIVSRGERTRGAHPCGDGEPDE